ncbi:MAG: Maf family nucleotide pyrophosphatase [Bacteroidales bacterium]|nr:Maf family nucleotide pyrophosphatase [Bacteroidales bacterium]
MASQHPLQHILSAYKVVLASQSPRRKHLLEGLDIPFEVLVKPGIDESFPGNLSKTEIPEFLSKKKAEAYKDILVDDNLLVITSDTIVWLEGQVIGKPSSYNDAFEILQRLSGKMHEVVTGVALTTNKKQEVFHSITKVHIRNIEDQEIDYYLKKYQPMDKAGAYGIQEWIGYAAVDHIEGSFHNVMGLPVQKLYNALQQFSFPGAS